MKHPSLFVDYQLRDDQPLADLARLAGNLTRNTPR